MRPNELSSDRGGVFAGDDPFAIARRWLEEAEETEPNDHNAMALATVDGDGLPNVRMVLLKDVRDDSFVFFTNYHSQKAAEVDVAGVASFVIHWKSLRRQIRVRGTVDRVDEAASDAYFGTRSIYSRIGAWASRQSAPLPNRGVLEERSRALAEDLGENPGRPPFWGGFQITPLEIEFWSDGEARLHDRFRWLRFHASGEWQINRLNP